MKKFNDNRNVIGNLIKEHREKTHYSKMELSRKLELLGIEKPAEMTGESILVK